MTIETLASDPAMLACFDRVCTLIAARGKGLTLRELSAASALARAWVAGNQERVEEFAAELKLDAGALS